jgi:diguanylate cyclase (GGDEF)-like protein
MIGWRRPTKSAARQLISVGAFLAMLVCGLGIPLFYIANEYEERAELLEFKAKLSASQAEKYIYEHQKAWRYPGQRLSKAIELPQTDDQPVHLRLIDEKGMIVAETGPAVSSPHLHRKAGVYVDGITIGHVDAEISLAPLLWTTLLTALASLGASVTAFFAFRVFPLRALDRTIQELQNSNQRFTAALAYMSQGFCVFDDAKRLVVCNNRYREIYALSPVQAAPGTPFRELLAHRVAQGAFAKGAALDPYVEEVYAFLRRGAAWSRVTELENGRYIAVSNRPMPGGWVSTHEDVTELRQRERELHAQNIRFDMAINNMAHGLCMFDGDRRLVVCNERYVEIYQIPAGLTVPGTQLEQILHAREASGLVAQDVVLDVISAAHQNVPAVQMLELRDGRSILVKHRPMPRGGWVATHEDVTEQRRAEARIAHLAHHDPLTDLPNRTLLHRRLEEACADLSHGKSVAVLCLDLDRFKEVNDTLGHGIGDALLKAVALRLQSCIREHDTLARIGGDEFAIVQTKASQPNSATVLAGRIIEQLTMPFEAEGHRILVGTSVGIAVAPNDGSIAGTLLKNADLALYQVKGRGRGSYQFFEPGMDALMHVRRQLESELREAVAASSFELHFQPILNLDHDRVGEFEALVRWRHPERGIVSPAEFIPLAEEIGLIGAVGAWVLNAACAQAASWPEDICVSVNLSPAQFGQGDLAQAIAHALDRSGLRPDRLMLEITESILLDNTDEVLATLRRLRELGVRIAMDDFGIGFSSLSSLSRFHFDKIKIDRSFVHGLGKSEHSMAIIEAVATLGARLDMTTTAEGVETSDQLAWLRAVGISEVQGFLIGKPQPAEEVNRMITAAGGITRSAA